MLRAIAAVASLLLFSGATALTGEEVKAGPFSSGNWAEAQQYAVKAQLIVVGKVVDAGKVNGKGWSTQNRGDNITVPLDIQQELILETSEVIRGKRETGKLTVKIQNVSYPLQSIYQLLNRQVNGKWTNRQSIPAAEFALAKDRTYLLFLAEPKTEKGKDAASADQLVALLLDGTSPLEEPDAQILASVRAFCRTLADWGDPPKLSAEDDARIKGLIADLGSDDFEKREGAETSLRKVGARAKVHLDAAAKDKDPERSFRAGELLKAAEPVPGKVEFPGQPRNVDKRPEVKPETPPTKGAP